MFVVTVVHLSKDKDFTCFSSNHDSSTTEPVQLDKYDSGASIDPHIYNAEKSSEDCISSSADIDVNVSSTIQPPVSSTLQAPVSSTIQAPVSSTIQTESDSTSNVKRHSETKTSRRTFTPNDISSAVTASEITRVCCSVAAAILVFLSYIGTPIPGSYLINNVVLSRPLYLLLVTNISIVVSYLLLAKQKGVVSSGKEANGASLLAAFGSVGQLGKALEAGLVVQHVVGALFMDCSVYSIIVVCFLSLAQKLGW